MAKPELVGHDVFYMKELNDMIDIKRDYDFWQARRYLPIVCIENELIKKRMNSFSIRRRKWFRFVIMHFFLILKQKFVSQVYSL
jgi:hypothetical protein